MVKKEENRFNKLQQEQRDLDASYQQSKRNKEERKDYSNPVAAAVRTPKFKSKGQRYSCRARHSHAQVPRTSY